MPGNHYIHWNAEFCTGCRLCELACSMRAGTGIAPSTAAIRLEDEAILVCRQCTPPAACAQACRFGALGDGLDPAKCTGCGLCVAACQYHSIFMPQPKTPPVRCDLCQGNPECVTMCPSGALKLLRKGRLALHVNRMQSAYRRWSNELFVTWVTRLNLKLTMMARKRLESIRTGKPEPLLNRLLLTPMVKPFKKNFASPEDQD